jgi:hypothetical protein
MLGGFSFGFSVVSGKAASQCTKAVLPRPRSVAHFTDGFQKGCPQYSRRFRQLHQGNIRVEALPTSAMRRLISLVMWGMT